jgi:hypothetical protein
VSSELHTGDLVSSISIEGLLRKRDCLVDKLRLVVDMLAECQRMTVEGNLLTESYRQFDWVIQGSNNTHGNTLLSQDGLKDILKRLDSALWGKLMHDSGLLTFMDSKAKAEFAGQVNDCKTPPLTRENIEASFSTLYANRDDIFDRGVINCFKKLSWCYKTNNPVKFGKRIIKGYLSEKWGSFNYNAVNDLEDLQRVFCLVDGKPEEDHRGGLGHRLRGAKTHAKEYQGQHDDTYMSIRWFKNGNGHITFLRLDLVDKLNSIIAKHFPGALPEARS